jgi:integrase
LTFPLKADNNIPTTDRRGYAMYGRVRCARWSCGKTRERNDWACPACGYIKSFVDVKHQGKRYRLKDGREFFTHIEKAHDKLSEIRLAYNDDKDSFNPLDYTVQALRERTLAWQADLWLNQKKEECEAGELSPGTLEDYSGYVRNHFPRKTEVSPGHRAPFDSLDVRKIDYAALENLKDALPRTLRIKTRRNIMNALHSLFRRMHRKGVIKDMPAFPTIEGNDSDTRQALTYEQQAEGLSRIPRTEDREAIEFGFEMLLRPGELCALQVRDIDQLHKRIIIRRTFSKGHLRETTKGRNKIWLPLTSRALEILAPRLAEKPLDAFIFINPRTGKAYRPKVFNRLWREFSGCGTDHYSAGRHSGCTQLVHDGTPHLEAQALMRHSDIRSTLHYFHADSDKLFDRLENRGKMSTIRALPKKNKAK